MEVTFEVAKTLKQAGYPQGVEGTAYYNENGTLIKPWVFNGGKRVADAPYYLDVWQWLWRERSIRMEVINSEFTNKCYVTNNKLIDTDHFDSPEEAIIAEINSLCNAATDSHINCVLECLQPLKYNNKI